jgi:hypothetical protein
MATASTSFILLACCVALVALYVRFRADRSHVAALRERALREFGEYKISSVTPELSFSGKAAKVLSTEEVGGARGLFQRTADYSLTVYAQSEHGEVFMYKWFSKSERPFVKHLPGYPTSKPTATR